jgi:flagellar basal-body rod modification protein FlgD
MASVSNDSSLPSNIMTTGQYKKQQEQAIINGKGDEMGQTAFLTLFTTQLKNQNPLDPMQNEAFVAQLAQFSQLEATTKMSTNIDTLVKSMSNSQISNASSMIGKTVAIADGKAIKYGEPVEGTVALDKDVDGITLKVINATTGQTVRTGQIGAQKKGDYPFTWDGLDNDGNAAADGVYRVEATVTRFGQSSKAAVQTMAAVRSVTTDTATGDMKLELVDGTKVSLSEVKRIGN